MKFLSYFIFLWFFILVFNEYCFAKPSALPSADLLPYQVSYQLGFLDYYKHICGGVIVSETWVLTAGRCVAQVPNGSGNTFKIIAGNGDRKQEVKVTEKVLHPEYNSENKTNDIALLRLATPLEFTYLIHPVKLPDIANKFYHFLSNLKEPLSYQTSTTNLQSVTLADHSDCISVLGEAYSETTNICTGILNEYYFSDCGNPLVLDDVLIAISSWIESDSLNKSELLPATYLKISNYIEFIKQHVTDLP